MAKAKSKESTVLRNTRFHGHSTMDVLDDTPVASPSNMSIPTPLHQLIARAVQVAVQEEKGEDYDSITEEDDFEEEDPETLDFSPYEFAEIQEDYFPDPTEMPDRPEPETAEAVTGDSPDPNDSEPDSGTQETIPQG